MSVPPRDRGAARRCSCPRRCRRRGRAGRAVAPATAASGFLYSSPRSWLDESSGLLGPMDEPIRRGGRPRRSSAEVLADAAAELFLEQGYGRTTVDQIAARAGVSRATFFNYFPAKSDVMWLELDAAVAGLPGLPGGVDRAERGPCGRAGAARRRPCPRPRAGAVGGRAGRGDGHRARARRRRRGPGDGAARGRRRLRRRGARGSSRGRSGRRRCPARCSVPPPRRSGCGSRTGSAAGRSSSTSRRR